MNHAVCKCEHWQVCPRCYPQGTFDDAGRLVVKSDNPTQIADRLARYGDADAAAELRRLYEECRQLRAALHDIAEHDHDLKCPNRPYEWVAMLRGFARATLEKVEK